MAAKPLALIGVPSSAGAFALGQENAPRALREAGIAEQLGAAGITVTDHGDGPVRMWRPDRARPGAQNLATVVEVVEETAARVEAAAAAGELPLVLGGDCTVGIGTAAGLLAAGRQIGLLYFDAHPDLNVPDDGGPGALDWMGVAHMLGEDGAERSLVEAGPRAPLLDAADLLLFAWDPGQATPREHRAIESRGLSGIPLGEVAGDPEGAAARAVSALGAGCEEILVHFDVDVIDFTDLPLSENTGRNEGLTFDVALTALAGLLASPQLAGLTVTELNPAHAEAVPGGLERFVARLVAALAASPAIASS